VTAPLTFVWLADTSMLADSVLDGYTAWFGEGERNRCARFVRAERRRQFIAGRALARLALARLLGVEPSGIRLTERPGQAPALAHPAAAQLSFSISHSGPWVGCAASAATAIGFDIERLDPARDVLALAEQAFTPDVLHRLHACPDEEKLEAFYRMWCLHEARIKLGKEGAGAYTFRHGALAGALCCARPLARRPVPALLDLG
jgi:4'-phosphopantetheinyl transferase